MNRKKDPRRHTPNLRPTLALLVMALALALPAAAQQCEDANGVPLAPTLGCKVNGADNVPCVGTPGKDKIDGTEGDDVIVGLGDKDKIKGKGGNDVICGGDGDDNIKGDDGNDVLRGGDGKNKLKGGAGNDLIVGGSGPDDIKGEDGDDTLLGGGDDDKIKGGEGSDLGLGGDGDDDIKGEDGNDALNGEGGTDKVDGGKDIDACEGESVKNCELPFATEEGEVVGQVTDPEGIPVEGVTVSVNPETTTDAGGLYGLEGLAEEDRVVVEFAKEGFVTTYGIADLSGEPPLANLNRVMLPAGDPQVVDAGVGGAVEQDGSVVTFPPGSLDAMGNVEVVVTPLDPSTPEIGAFPGDFLGLAAGGGEELIETFALIDVQLTQGGEPVDLVPGMTATIEFLLPMTTPLVPGDLVPLWFFDEETGLWLEEGAPGEVVASSTTPGRLAVLAEVAHFSWWNCDRPITTKTCLSGTVTDADGNPVAGASVYASGVTYNGTSYAYTDASGNYCLNVKGGGETVEVTASYLSGAIQSASQTVITGPSGIDCSTGGCDTLPDLMLPGLSCVQGTVLDELGNPVQGVSVGSTGGGSAVSDVNGEFCFTTPESTDVTVYAPGFESETTTSPPEGPTCEGGGCAVVELRPPAAGTTTCLSGLIFEEFSGDPLEGIEVLVFRNAAPFELLGSELTGVDGTYCIELLPANTEVQIFPSCEGDLEILDTGDAFTECAADNCVVVRDLGCFGEGS